MVNISNIVLDHPKELLSSFLNTRRGTGFNPASLVDLTVHSFPNFFLWNSGIYRLGTLRKRAFPLPEGPDPSFWQPPLIPHLTYFKFKVIKLVSISKINFLCICFFLSSYVIISWPLHTTIVNKIYKLIQFLKNNLPKTLNWKFWFF